MYKLINITINMNYWCKCKWPPSFLSIQKCDWWITLFGCINVANKESCLITFVLFVKWRKNSIPVISISSGTFYLYRWNESSLELTWPLQQNKNTVGCIVFSFHLFRQFKTHKGNHTLLIARILMYRYCFHVHQ